MISRLRRMRSMRSSSYSLSPFGSAMRASSSPANMAIADV